MKTQNSQNILQPASVVSIQQTDKLATVRLLNRRTGRVVCMSGKVAIKLSIKYPNEYKIL